MYACVLMPIHHNRDHFKHHWLNWKIFTNQFDKDITSPSTPNLWYEKNVHLEHVTLAQSEKHILRLLYKNDPHAFGEDNGKGVTYTLKPFYTLDPCVYTIPSISARVWRQSSP